MVDMDDNCHFFLGDLHSKLVGLVCELAATSALSLHSSNQLGKLSQWLCHDYSTINIILVIIIINRAHSFPRQILPNSAAPFAKFRGSPRQILGIPRLTAAARFRVYCIDFGPVMPQNVSIIVTSNY